jgi:hypothetical protein
MPEEVSAQTREAYEAPALRELGDANELTAGQPDTGGSVLDFSDN